MMTTFLTTSQVVLGCAVCVGDPNSPVTVGMNMAILFLLAVVAVMLGSVFTFILYLARKQREAMAEVKVDDRQDPRTRRRS